MKNVILSFFVGIFFMTALIILFYFTIIKNPTSLFSDSHFAEIQFQSISNLSVGHPVILRGIKVGKVTKLNIDENFSNITATVSLNRKIPFYKNYKIEIKEASLLGGRFINIENGDHQKGLTTDIILKGTPSLKINDIIVSTLQEIKERAKQITAPIKQVEQAFKNIRKFTENLNNSKGSLHKLINDDSLYKSLRAFSKKINDIAQKVDGKEVKKIIKNLEVFTKKINSPEGTLGKIIKNPEIYDELKTVLTRAREILEDLQEQAPVQTVGSIIFGNL